MDTNRHKFRWTLFAALTSRDEAHPGARASRPHQSWHSLGQFRPCRPATAPGHCFGRAHAVPAGRVAGCHIAEIRAARNGSACGRDARAPGWRLFPSLLLLDGARAGLPGRTPTDAAVPSPLLALRGPEWKTPRLVSNKKNPVHPVHRCESKICSCMTLNRFPATRRRRLFQSSSHSSQAGGKQAMECSYGGPV